MCPSHVLLLLRLQLRKWHNNKPHITTNRPCNLHGLFYFGNNFAVDPHSEICEDFMSTVVETFRLDSLTALKRPVENPMHYSAYNGNIFKPAPSNVAVKRAQFELAQ